MIYPEADAPMLKGWIVKRLDNNSDADPDILADYVLALLRHEGDEEAVRALCLEEIPDFLQAKEGLPADSTAFVNDIFDCIRLKAYLPGRSLAKMRQSAVRLAAAAQIPPRPGLPSKPPPINPFPAGGPSATGSQAAASAPPTMNSGRKRSYHDRVEADSSIPEPDSQERRPTKQPRWEAGTMTSNVFSGLQNAQPITAEQAGVVLPSPAASGVVLVPPGHQYAHPPPAPIIHSQYLQAPPHPAAPGGYHAPPVHYEMGQPPKRGSRNRCRLWDTTGFCPRGAACKFAHIMAPAVPVPYDPTNPSLNMRGIPAGPHLVIPGLPLLENFAVRTTALPKTKKTSALTRSKNRSPFSAVEGMVHDRNSTSIVVENIPEENFTQQAIQGFFSQFGTINLVSLPPGPKKVAIVKYETHASALAAYKSPKVIFDTRFVKVYWYKDAGAKATAASAGGQPHDEQVHASVPEEADMDMEEFLRKQAEAQKIFEERSKMKQELLEQREQIELRQKEIREEKRKILGVFAAKGLSIKEEEEEEEDEDEDGEIHISTGDKGHQSAPTPMSKEALRAKLAEVEAEALQYGIDPEDDTESVAGWNTSFRGGSRGRGRGAFRGRGGYRGGFRGGYRGRGSLYTASFGTIHEAYARYSLDNRPKTVLLSGVDLTAAQPYEALRHHLLASGEFSCIEHSMEGTRVAFKDRKTAEKFFNSVEGGIIPGVDGKMEVSWAANNSNATPRSGSSDQPTTVTSGGGGAQQQQQKKQTTDGFDIMTGTKNGSTSEQVDNAPHVDYDVADDNEWDIA